MGYYSLVWKCGTCGWWTVNGTDAVVARHQWAHTRERLPEVSAIVLHTAESPYDLHPEDLVEAAGCWFIASVEELRAAVWSSGKGDDLSRALNALWCDEWYRALSLALGHWPGSYELLPHFAVSARERTRETVLTA